MNQPRIAARLAGLRPTAVNAVLQEVRQLQAEGRSLVSLMRGQPDTPTAEHIIAAAQQALRQGRTGYPDNQGEPELRRAVAEKLARDGLTYDPEREILITDGATAGIAFALGALVQPGDDVLLPDPIYDAYTSPIALWGGRPVPIRSVIRAGRFCLDRAALEAAVTPRSRVLLLNTPWNPVGTVLTRDELRVVMDIAVKHDLCVIGDEIYESLVYDGRRHVSPAAVSPGARERTLLVNSLSKTYAMTGWRVGYCAGPAEAIRAMLLILQQSSRGPATFVQDAAACALRSDQECVRRMTAEYQQRRDLVLSRLRGIPGVEPLVPEGGLFVIVDVRQLGRPSDEVRRFLLREAGVVVIHGAAYGPGGEGTLRVSFAAGGETLERGLERLREGLLRLADQPRAQARVQMSVAELPVVANAAVDVAGLRAALEKIEGEVRFDRLSRALYSTDASVYQIVPAGVVLPKTEDDVRAVLAACTRFGVPITARGGGTSQAGQAIGPGVVLDFSKYLNQVLEINAAERWVRVQPGCVLDDLNLQLKPHGLQFAPDISTSNRATIGGMVANNSSGTHSLIHGLTIDHVLEVRALLADGSMVHCRPLDEAEVETKCAQRNLEGECHRTIRRLAAEHADEIERRYPKVLRRVGGYNLDRFVPSSFSRDAQRSAQALRCASRLPEFNLAHLLVGSEGTLAITLEAKLRLVELPKAKVLLIIQFADLLEALAATPLTLRHSPAAVEVIDKYVLDSTKLNAEASRLREFLQGDPGAILIVEFYGDGTDELPPRLDALEDELRQRGLGYHYLKATDAALQSRVWKLRKLSLGLSMAEKGDAKAISFVEDSAVAPERLRDYIAEFLQVIARHGTTAGVYAHASVGCLHVRPVVNLKTEAGVRQFELIAAEVAELVLKYGGALSGEHGDGLVRSAFQEKMFGPALYQAFREIKRTFDSCNLLNPGKIVDAPPLATNLRYGPKYVTPQVPTTFDFSADGGLVQAAELCAGVGECRKSRDGTMCPSYQATRDEQHSTRGRANALRLALTGQVGLQGLTDPALMEALDLCLECKACKSECPTNVDMARLKAEFLHQYYRKHGLPWRSWVFGNVATLSKWGCRLAPVSSRMARSRLGRWLNEKLLGIDRRRTPPAFARKSLAARLIMGRDDLSTAKVLLFPDTFVNFHEPEVGQAALDTLRLLGASALPLLWANAGLKLRCCGRPLISNGLLAHAAEHARHNVERLYDWLKEDKPIIACEPSCILTIKDDYPALLRGELRRKAEAVAAACRTFEEFVESILASRERQRPEQVLRSLTPPAHRILVQGHCHQRSLVGMGPTLRLLRRIPGAEVIDLDAGCCGMAGSFGYEKEHYEISRLVGEQRLFPALRQAGDDTVVVAPGFSCRMQIEHFTGRKALHPAELLFSLLSEPSPP